METRTAICVDSDSLEHPELIGLEDESLLNQSWLEVYCDAGEARSALRKAAALDTVWVVSSDTMEGINLAAALKRDCRDRDISLVSFGASGSVVGRCEAAGVGLLHSREEFLRRYADRKHACMQRRSDAMRGQQGERAARRSIASLNVEEPDAQATVPFFELCEDDAALPRGQTLVRRQGAAGIVRRAVFPAAPQATGHNAFVASFVSGSGGSGKSTLAASSAVFAQACGLKTLLVDADLQFGDMGVLIGRDDALDLSELMDDPSRIARVEAAEGLPALLSAPAHLEQSEELMSYMAEMIGYVKAYFDVVIVNTGSFWTEQHAQLIEASDATLFVLDQRPSSIRACGKALDLCRRCGIATQSFRFVLNFCSRQALLTSLDVSCALKGVKVSEVRDGGREVGELLGAGLPRDLLASKNAFSESLKGLCSEIIPALAERQAEPPSAGKRKRARRRLWGRRKRSAACL